MKSEFVRIAHIERRTNVEGPGTRWALWTQGCSVRCPGCCNPHTWDQAGGILVDVETLAQDACSSGVEGITLLGGEPFEQAGALALLAARVRDAGLGVVVFTGYVIERLRLGILAGATDLLDATDLLIDGPFVAARLDVNRPWAGSTNQRFFHLSDRYRDHPQLCSGSDGLEIRIRRDGSVFVNGWPHAPLIDEIIALAENPIS